MRSIFSAALLLALLGTSALADVIVLKTGEEIHGRVVGESDDRKIIQLDGGGVRSVNRLDIVRIMKRDDGPRLIPEPPNPPRVNTGRRHAPPAAAAVRGFAPFASHAEGV